MGTNLTFSMIIVAFVAFAVKANESEDRLKKDRKFPNEDGLLVLTDQTFQCAEDTYDFLFVLFVADWCGMCSMTLNYLKDELPALKKEYPNIGFAKIEATFYREYYNKYDANGYPTVLLISKGHKIQEYAGTKTFLAIGQWLNEKTLPSVIPVDSMEMFNKIKNSPFKLPMVAYFGYDFNELNDLEKYSNENLKRFRFIKIKNQDLMNQLNRKPRQVTLFKTFDEPEVSIYGSDQNPLTYETYKKFFDTYSHLLVISEERSVKDIIFSPEKSGLIFIYEMESSLPSLSPIIEEVALQTRDKLQTAYVPVNRTSMFRRFDKTINITTLPSVVLANFMHNNSCLLDITDESVIYNANSLINYVNSWYEGTVDLSNCREIPNDLGKPVRNLNEEQFERDVLRSRETVFVKFYAPWCGHCKKFEPEFIKLAKHMESYSMKIKFVEVDATVNKIKGVDIRHYPTLMLYKAGKKHHPIEYKGNRSFGDLVRFLLQNNIFF